MAKAKATENMPLPVPAAELVGDHAKTGAISGSMNDVGTAELSIADGTEISVGIDLGIDGGSILTTAVYLNGVYKMDVQALELADLISIISVTDDDEKREILKALHIDLMVSNTETQGDTDHVDQIESARDSYCKQYPHLSHVMNDWKATGQTAVPTLRIVSKIEGFWRAGIQHTIQPVELSMANLTPDQAELLLSENTLIIELI